MPGYLIEHFFGLSGSGKKALWVHQGNSFLQQWVKCKKGQSRNWLLANHKDEGKGPFGKVKGNPLGILWASIG